MRSIIYLSALLQILVSAAPAWAVPGVPATVSYTSSVDGATLNYHEYVPNGFAAAKEYKLAVLLTGSGGNIGQYDSGTAWRNAADSHGYILVTVQPRLLTGYSNTRTTFFMNGALAPGEQDVLDVLPVIASRYAIDGGRIYISGYSMGGFGALNIATMNPGVFAAAAPGAPISDLFQEAQVSPFSNPDFAALLGGAPGASTASDTFWYQNSPRFLLRNLMNTPVRIVHGTADTVIPNALAVWPYMHSRHVVDSQGYGDERGQITTLQELAAAWPGRYYEEHLWPAGDHGSASLEFKAEDILNFFDAHELESNPASVAFSTYDDKHTEAYWLKLELSQPGIAVPGSVYATNDPAANTVQLTSAGSVSITLDLLRMGLSSEAPITIQVSPEDGSAGDVELKLRGAWPAHLEYAVTMDGQKLADGEFEVTETNITLLRRSNAASHVYVISGAPATPAPEGCTVLDLTDEIADLGENSEALWQSGSDGVATLRLAAADTEWAQKAGRLSTAADLAEASLALGYSSVLARSRELPRQILRCQKQNGCKRRNLTPLYKGYQKKILRIQQVITSKTSILMSAGSAYREAVLQIRRLASALTKESARAIKKLPALTFDCSDN